MSEQIEKDKYVSLTYSISDESGDVLESTDMPIHFIYGRDHKVISKIEQALAGRQAGDRLSVSLSPGEGFGEHMQELTYVDELDNVPEEFRHVGAEIEFQNDIGESRIFRVTHIDSDTLTVDGNHPFAGKHLLFTITIQAVRDASAEEISRGHSVEAEPDARLH